MSKPAPAVPTLLYRWRYAAAAAAEAAEQLDALTDETASRSDVVAAVNISRDTAIAAAEAKAALLLALTSEIRKVRP